MNCKPNDLAIIAGKAPLESGSDLGKIVRVIESGDDWSDEGDSRFFWSCNTLGQRLEFMDGSFSDGVECVDIADVHLRPVRDSDGCDEMLRIAGKPKTTLLEECNRLIADFNKLAEWCKEHQK